MAGAIRENIALLALLGPKLRLPAENQVADAVRNDPSSHHRSLSFKYERGIAEAFTVFLATTDNPKKVGAICVEDKRDGTGLVLRTAVNSGSQAERKETF